MTYAMLRRLDTGETRDDMILRVADGAHIPADPANSDWQAYLAWRADGNAPGEPAAPKPAASAQRSEL